MKRKFEFLLSSDLGCWIFVYLQPGAKKNEVVGIHDGLLKIKIKSPPIEGRANEELLRFLSTLFEIPMASMKIAKGELSRRKKIFVTGWTEEALTTRVQMILTEFE